MARCRPVLPAADWFATGVADAASAAKRNDEKKGGYRKR
jgi:hypothetical protein